MYALPAGHAGPRVGTQGTAVSDETPIFEIETVRPPRRYSDRQIREAALIAATLNRGKLVLATEPEDH